MSLYPKALEGWTNFLLKENSENNKSLVFEKVKTLSFPALSELEKNCPLLNSVMTLEAWWERLFAFHFPITNSRYQSSSAYRANATVFLNCKIAIDYKLLWEKLNFLMSEKELQSFSSKIISPNIHMCIGTSFGDEFGIGSVFYKNGNELFSIDIKNNIKTKPIRFATWMGSHETNKPAVNNNNQIHGIPLQSRVILEVFAPNGRELLLLDPNDENKSQTKDPSCWAINYPDNNWLDLPPFLTGDPSLSKPLIAATEKNFHQQTMKTNACFAVHLKRFDYLPHDLLIFDQLKTPITNEKQTTETWHQHVTERIRENQDVIGITFVLQYYLLLASSDGIIYARPRNNPKSLYHIADFKEPILFVTSTWNVIALTFANRLSVFHVSEISIDPFLKLTLIHEQLLNFLPNLPAFPSFLFGPFILFQQMEMDRDEEEDDYVAVKEQIDFEKNLPEHIQSKNIPESVKTTKNWNKNRKIMLHTFGFDKKIQEVKDEEKEKERIEILLKHKKNKNDEKEKRGSIWLLINYETKQVRSVSFPNIDKEWRFSHIKSASLSYFVATFYSKKRFSDRIVNF